MDYDEFTRTLKAELREKGRTESGPLAGHPLMILTTKGARSGAEREAIVTYSRQDGDYVIAASKSGAPTNPAWYHNLVAHPEVKVEANRETFRARARVTNGEERDRLWEQHATALPWFREYPTKTDRVIPVIVLERVA
ncbi:MAG TPA: nitroreductase/quinone reductase family protein [Candidatus Limnocylindria bacterium]